MYAHVSIHKNIREPIDMCAYTSPMINSVKKPNRTRLPYSVTLPPKLVAQADERAKISDGDRSKLVERLLREWMEAGSPPPHEAVYPMPTPTPRKAAQAKKSSRQT